MNATDRLLTRSEDRPAVSIRWNRTQVISARHGDTVSLALLDAGVLETSRSVKYRRPRGAYCLKGDCGTCLVRIDGRPNRRACLTPVREGMQVLPQNQVLEGSDPSGLFDTMIRGRFDHHHLMVRPRVVNQVMQSVARTLTGLGTLPDHLSGEPAQHQWHYPDVLIIGAGAAGTAAHEVLTAAGRQVLWVDRGDRYGLEAQAGQALPTTLRDRTGIFGAYPEEQLWSAMGEPRPGAAVLYSIRPRHVVIATGARDPMLPVTNNDRPGVVSARGLLAQLRRSQARLRVPALVVGAGAHALRWADALGVDAVAPHQVERIEGHIARGLRLRDGFRACRIIALAAVPAPAFELARQAGAAVRWDGHGFAVDCDNSGRCSGGPGTMWAAGDVTGYRGPTAAEDGRRVALALLAADASGA